jgi:glutamate--cysteine ligase
MSTRLPSGDGTEQQPVTPADLLAYFHTAGKPREQWRVGAEFERFLVEVPSGKPLPYEGAGGIWEILSRLAGRFGWVPFINEARYITALRRGGATLSMEPGGQLELSTAPAETLVQIAAELDTHRDELASVLDPEAVAVLAAGVHPTTRADGIPLMPRVRHRVMAEYLPPRSPTALDMMKGTCSTQAAFDFADEADAARKMTIALKLSPLVNVLWGNGAIYGGELTGMASYRGHVWRHMDPDRSGSLLPLIERGFSFQGWVDYLLDMPMMLTFINGRYQPAHGRTFRDFLERGEEDYFPTLEDWEVHITTAFPEVRLKKFVEVRGADACPRLLAQAVPAFWKGLLYDDQVLAEAGQLAATIPTRDLEELTEQAYWHGLAGKYQGRELATWCRELVTLSARGLGDERAFLDPLFAVLERGQSPGMAFCNGSVPDLPSLLARFAFEPYVPADSVSHDDILPPTTDHLDQVF